MRPVTVSRAQDVSIGELSRRTGVNVETIRYYERVKVLPAPQRTEGGHRLYGPNEARALAFVRRARELGFGLDQIRALLGLAEPTKASCAEVRAIAARHLEDVRAKIADLEKLDRLLTKTIKQCSGKAVPECAMLDVLDASRAVRVGWVGS
jgi:MerR family mercuric resistance operon transcriptional regulator